VENSLKTIINQLSHFQDKIDDIQNQIELSDSELTQDKLNQLTTSQSEYQKKFDDTIKSLNNIKINNKDIEDNFKKQVNTIKESIANYQLSLSDKTLQFEYKKLVEKHPKTTKFFTYSCKNNNIFLSIKDPKYVNIVNKLILKSYENLWDIQTGLNEPTLDNLSYYIDGNYDGWESSSSSSGDEEMDEDDNKKEKSFIGNTTLIDFQKQLEEKLLNEINKDKACSSNKYEDFNNKINNIQNKLSTDFKKEYENLYNKLQILDLNNKEEMDDFKKEFRNMKDLFNAQEKSKQEIKEINRQLKAIKHENLRERQTGNYKEKAKLDYTYNTIDFSESYDSFLGFLSSLEKENIQENQYYNSLSGKTYKPNERDREFNLRIKQLNNQVQPKEPHSIAQWYYIKENNDNELIDKHQQIVTFTPDEFEAIRDVEGTSTLFQKNFRTKCPKYKNKDTGYDRLRDFKFYLQNYAPPTNEIQIIDAFGTFVEKNQETKKWYSQKKKEILNLMRDNPRIRGILAWNHFNRIVKEFEFKYCEFTILEQQKYWNSIKPCYNLSIENFNKLIHQIEKVAVNLHIEYADKVIKLIQCIKDPIYFKFIKNNIVKLPVTDKAINLEQRNIINKTIYLDTIKLIYEKLQNHEGEKLINKSFSKIFDKPNPNSNNISVRKITSSKKSKILRSSNHETRQKSHQVTKKSLPHESNSSYTTKTIELNNIIIGKHTHINNTERDYSGKFIPSMPVNNPKFARIKWNRGMILTHEGIFDSIFMLDSGSDPNVIGLNVLNKLNITPKQSSHTSSIVSGGKITQVNSYIYLKIAINLGKKTYYIKNVKFNVIDTKRPNNASTKNFYYFDKIILGDNVLHEMETYKKYPKIYPEFLNIEQNRNNDLIYKRKGVYDPEWDRIYLDKNLHIKDTIKNKQNNEHSVKETNNSELMFMTKEEMKKVEEQIQQHK